MWDHVGHGTRRGSRAGLGGGAAADGVPDFTLVAFQGRLFADARMDNGLGVSEVRAGGPAAVFDAKDVERKRFGADGDKTVFADNAVLFAAADKFSGEEQERALAAVDEDKLVDGGSRRICGADDAVAAIAIAGHALGALFPDDYFAGREAFVEGEEPVGVVVVGADYREDG